VSKQRRFSVWHMFKTTSFWFPPRLPQPNTGAFTIRTQNPYFQNLRLCWDLRKRKGKEREKWRRERNAWPWWELELFWALFLQSYFLSFFRGESLSASASLPFSILTLFMPLVLTIRSRSIWLPRKRRKRERNHSAQSVGKEKI
jgi:hypothetical protein